MIKDYNHPSIFVYCSLGINEVDIEEILWGIEEEGIPFILKNKDLNKQYVFKYEGNELIPDRLVD